MAETDEQPTCGKGIAERSKLTAMLGELVAGTARVLEVHMKALDVSDPNSKAEFDAYRDIATAHRRIAADLASTAERMAGYRTLPMGRHDMAIMMSPAPRHAFAGFVKLEGELAALLTRNLERDHAMLEQMSNG
jgi:hypothetical protein